MYTRTCIVVYIIHIFKIPMHIHRIKRIQLKKFDNENVIYCIGMNDYQFFIDRFYD